MLRKVASIRSSGRITLRNVQKESLFPSAIFTQSSRIPKHLLAVPCGSRYLSHPADLTTPERLQEPSENMASDEDYMNFLNKANEGTSGGSASAQSSGGQHKFKTTDSGRQVPLAIQKAIKDEVYVTDADEPFEGVALQCQGGLPDEEAFAKLINHPSPSSADVEIMDPTDWDTKGQYEKIIDAVREASRGADVRVYRVKRDGTRAEYWVVSAAEGGIVGAKALGVES